MDHNAKPTTRRKPPMDRKRRMRLLMSYAPDWIITIVVTGLFFILGNIRGFRRNFSLNDEGIQYPYAVHERVPNYLLVVISLIAPLAIMPIINVITVRSLWDWHNSWLGLILSWGLTGTLTNIVKVTAGRPRPDLIDRCQPMAGSQNAAVYGLVTSAICTQTDEAIMKDGFKSFFSGHSSLSFAGLGFLFFYISGKVHLYDNRGRAGKAWIAFLPLVGAILVAISRTMDYRHHFGDVVAGALVGMLTAWFCYRQYYPPLDSALSHHPYSPRIRPDEEPTNGSAAGLGQSGSGEALNLDGTVPRQNADRSQTGQPEHGEAYSMA
ncbi:hypothetical protein FRB94_000184 [Tulasnella sp. JGI-2019a]|nr:hypothetical protein FRB94_000184 [Tulasnella sp. JGI-2019a]KAG9015867.1 hypothetical protein FRB93_012432 [Tulasnella sp. JGI-2019a]KAG9039500.1 hypothetical protein FRB95_009080 [Tulasnella sp. JGI-2019a]